MATREREEAGGSDPDAGIWRGRSVARRFRSPDGWIVLVGRTAADNDVLSLKLGAARDFWLHVSGDSGSHVVIRNPDGLERPPRDTVRYAAGLAAGYSRARHGGQVTVHLATCADVSKPRGLPPGKVVLRRFSTVRAAPIRADDASAP